MVSYMAVKRMRGVVTTKTYTLFKNLKKKLIKELEEEGFEISEIQEFLGDWS